MLVLTSGYNLVNFTSGPTREARITAIPRSTIFVYDISGNGQPTQTQVIHVPNTYAGITFNPNRRKFYVSGGVDDNVHIYDFGHGHDKFWSEAAGSPVALGHTASPPVSLGGVGLSCPAGSGRRGRYRRRAKTGCYELLQRFHHLAYDVSRRLDQINRTRPQAGEDQSGELPGSLAVNILCGSPSRATARPTFRASAIVRLSSWISPVLPPLRRGSRSRGNPGKWF